MSNVIVLLGKPGAGKGSQKDKFLIGREDHYDTLSVGDMLREARKNGTELGKKAAEFMDAGALVPDDIINGIVIDGLKYSEKPIFSDGFPRTVVQAEAMLEAGISPLVIDFYVDDDIVIQRSKDRIVCDECGEIYTLNNYKPPKVEGICDKCGGPLVKRVDDDPETVKNRLVEYREKTLPVRAFFSNRGIKVFTIDNTADNAYAIFEQLVLNHN